MRITDLDITKTIEAVPQLLEVVNAAQSCLDNIAIEMGSQNNRLQAALESYYAKVGEELG